MKPGIPLFFFHMGDSYYLPYTFNQILQSNPDSDIYLIGDEANKHYESLGIIHVEMHTCEATAKEFEKIYVHLSSMGGFVERICFQRWMYIRDFVKQAGITGRFCHLDSDVLVYGNLTEYHDKYCADADVTLHGKYGPGTNVFKNVDVLSKLVDTAFRYYTDPALLQKLKDLRRNTVDAKGNHKNITDMTMIEAFVDECDVKTYDLLQIVDGITFDSHIAKASDPRFQMEGQFKKVIFRDRCAYCVTPTGEQVKMMMLHIQGFYKMYMYRYYTGDGKKVPPKIVPVCRLAYQSTKKNVYNLLVKLGLK